MKLWVCVFLAGALGRFLGEMDGDSLNKALEDHKEALVLFYTNDCLTCEKIRTEFDAACDSIAENIPEFLLGSVNVSTNPSLIKSF